MRRSIGFVSLAIAALLSTFSAAHAAECTIPNTFTAGSPAVADEVNANFSAIETAVNDNDSRIATLEAALATMQATISTMQTRIADLEANNAALQSDNTALSAQLTALEDDVSAIQSADYSTGISNLDSRLAMVESNTILALDGVVTMDTDDSGYDRVLIEGVNVQIVSGSGATDATVNGTGNLIVGYNEFRGFGNARNGSHNMVVGYLNNYSSYGGLVVGRQNSISGQCSSVTGGWVNTASGDYSSVSGGQQNTASGGWGSVSGGHTGTASAFWSSVSGGQNGTASGQMSSVSGGQNNTASGGLSSVSGGWLNTASGDMSSVSGGESRSVSGDFDWRAGDNFQDN